MIYIVLGLLYITKLHINITINRLGDNKILSKFRKLLVLEMIDIEFFKETKLNVLGANLSLTQSWNEIQSSSTSLDIQ